ncbi:MAG: ribbon-helix-helix protein, CopG family [Proteobacteria bacterium]|nr:ribbon-helix-helix protein, CopG family [Pseudomonadota bacterium]
MPAVSFYLNQDTLRAVRTKAKTENTPVSQIIRKALEEYLLLDEKKAAKKRVLATLMNEKPLGGTKEWESLHRERSEADADRG